jgi:hypothetical protein
VRLGDGLHDGQTEPDAFFVAVGPVRGQPLERLKEFIDHASRDDIAGVGHRDDGPSGSRLGLDFDPASVDVVAQRIVHQV